MTDPDAHRDDGQREYGRELVGPVVLVVPVVALAILANEVLGVDAFWIELVLVVAAVARVVVVLAARRHRGDWHSSG